jgi:L-alanine-DL-glutamate epimerase-like enolase superfamily enzyme
MKIESVDFFYLSMPQVLDIGDGSQDALLVRIRGGGFEGWGECEASPLTSIASYVCPMSHSACKPVKSAVEGRSVKDVDDIRKISRDVQEQSLDLLQANHTLSGVDIALYDLLGRHKNAPVFDLLGYSRVYPKVPYASQLFGDDAQQTFLKAQQTRQAGFRAVKFGWGPFGKSTLQMDVDQLKAAREGAGHDCILMIDAGTVWGEDKGEAELRMATLREVNAFWLEEPFVNGALTTYRALSEATASVPIAAGEGCNNFVQAQAMIDHAGIRYIQIDAGRIGGITVAKRVADYAKQNGVHYVNHTFTSNLALSASLQPYAGIEESFISEFPVELKQLAIDIGEAKITRDADGYIHVPEESGLGVTVNFQKLKKYLVDVEIRVGGKVVYATPEE